jgi:hypothetical protein
VLRETVLPRLSAKSISIPDVSALRCADSFDRAQQTRAARRIDEFGSHVRASFLAAPVETGLDGKPIFCHHKEKIDVPRASTRAWANRARFGG